MKRIAAVIAASLMGCTSMPDVKVEGLGDLKTTEHVMSQVDSTITCAKFMGIPAAMAWLVLPLACARIYLTDWTCDIYYAEATASFTLEHERLHCKGYWHDDRLLVYRDAWRSNQERDK